MYKISNKHLEGVKEVIDAHHFTESGGILDRALDVAVSKNDRYLKNAEITYDKKRTRKIGRL